MRADAIKNAHDLCRAQLVALANDHRYALFIEGVVEGKRNRIFTAADPARVTGLLWVFRKIPISWTARSIEDGERRARAALGGELDFVTIVVHSMDAPGKLMSSVEKHGDAVDVAGWRA